MNKYVLVLPSWYPSSVDRFNGDFNERLVRAQSAFCDQVVLYVVKSNKRATRCEIFSDGPVSTYLIYYWSPNIPIIGSFYSFYKYVSLNKKFITEIIQRQGNVPLVIHCYVLLKAAYIGKWAKSIYKVPLVLTEHWSAFLKSSSRPLVKAEIFQKRLIRKLLQSCDLIIAVSQLLKTSLQQWESERKIEVVPNVVDTDIFKPKIKPVTGEKFRYLHVSSMHPSKNVETILRAFERILMTHVDAELWLVGKPTPGVHSLIDSSPKLSSCVKCKGEVSYSNVAEIMQLCNCLVMFSEYETFSCVAAEALCCGLPVIISSTTGIRDFISEDNGIIVPTGDQELLWCAMRSVFENYSTYNRVNIAAKAANQFSYAVIAERVMGLYDQVVSAPKVKP